MSRTENMIVVIQCAGGKRKKAGHLEDAGRKVLFVADPASAPQSDSVIYKRPDDAASSGRSYRDVLEDYNGTSGRTTLWACSPHGNSTRTTPIGRSKNTSASTVCISCRPAGDSSRPNISCPNTTSLFPPVRRAKTPTSGGEGTAATATSHATRADFEACRVPGWEGLRPALPAPDGRRRSANGGLQFQTPPPRAGTGEVLPVQDPHPNQLALRVREEARLRRIHRLLTSCISDSPDRPAGRGGAPRGARER